MKENLILMSNIIKRKDNERNRNIIFDNFFLNLFLYPLFLINLKVKTAIHFRESMCKKVI